jgi:hypothetical protein
LPYLFDFAAGLQARLDWEPGFWITQPNLEQSFTRRFPGAIRQDFSDENRGLDAPSLPGGGLSVDPADFIRDGALFSQGREIVSRYVLGRFWPMTRRSIFYFSASNTLRGWCWAWI